MDFKSFLQAFRHRNLSDVIAIERLTAERDEFEAKLKLAATDLAAQAEEIGRLSERLSSIYAADDWQAQGYKTREEEINDMANVGRSLMDRLSGVIEPGGEMAGWNPMDDPAEIVTDMANTIYELRIINEANAPDALLWRAARDKRAARKGAEK